VPPDQGSKGRIVMFAPVPAKQLPVGGALVARAAGDRADSCQHSLAGLLGHVFTVPTGDTSSICVRWPGNDNTAPHQGVKIGIRKLPADSEAVLSLSVEKLMP